MAKSQDEKVLLGEAAEYLVISRLMRYGVLAGQPPRGWKKDDVILADGSTLQVKATDKGPKHGWMVGNVEALPTRRFALVDYQHATDPVVYVVPSDIVRAAAEGSNAMYRALRPHTAATSMRKVQDPWPFDVPGFAAGWLGQWRERWDES